MMMVEKSKINFHHHQPPQEKNPRIRMATKKKDHQNGKKLSDETISLKSFPSTKKKASGQLSHYGLIFFL